MTEPKWKIDSITIGGNAIVGDQARMVVYEGMFGSKPLQHPAQAEVKQAISALRADLDAPPAQGEQPLATSDRDKVVDELKAIVAELQKPRETQQPSRLANCIKAIASIVEPIPGLVKVFVTLKGALGF